MRTKRNSFFYQNGLSIIVLTCMLISLAGQFFTGWHEKNDELKKENMPALNLIGYAKSGHFIQATFENWESEFLQMCLYVLLTVSLRQKGSAESKKLFEKEEVDREPKKHANAPWPVKKGGIWLKIYSHSLSIAFGILFIVSFILHFYGSLKNYNEEQIAGKLPIEGWRTYIGESRFWFESFQNWQSEFLAVASIVLLSIWLREKGSPESKPVDAPHSETA